MKNTGCRDREYAEIVDNVEKIEEDIDTFRMLERA